jgi:hypothetical protein
MTENNANVCCICLLPEDDGMWACAVCSVKCHNTCVNSWVRTNYDRIQMTFSCPVCRQTNNVTTLPRFDIPRPTLSGFIASVLQSVRLSETDPDAQSYDYTQENAVPVSVPVSVPVGPVPAGPVRQRRPPMVSINGTGAIHIERVTIVNHF